MAALSSELQALRSQLEDAASLHEREVQSAREACADLQSHADVALKEVQAPLKMLKQHICIHKGITVSLKVVSAPGISYCSWINAELLSRPTRRPETS